MKRVLSVIVAVFMLATSVVSAADYQATADNFVTNITIENSNFVNGAYYGFVVVKGSGLTQIIDFNETNIHSDLLYIDQATAADGKISFAKIGLKDTGAAFAGGTAFVGGSGLQSATAVANITPPPASVAVTGVTLDKTTASVEKDATVTLVETVLPSDATNKNVSWKSDDTTIATVVDGVVTGVKAGSTKITVTTADGNFTAECVVTVTEESTGGETAKPGDMDGNEIVNSDDAVYLLGHVMFPSAFTITLDGDVDNNDILNSDDAVYLLGYTMFPSAFPLYPAN